MNVAGDHLRFGPGQLELDDLYLLRLQRTGCTIQIILGRANRNTTEAGRNAYDSDHLSASATLPVPDQYQQERASSTSIPVCTTILT